jgi:hypothetical protein
VLSTINKSKSYTKNFTITDGSSAILSYALSSGIGTLVRASSFLENSQNGHKNEGIRVSWVGLSFFSTTNANTIHNFIVNLGNG